MYKAKKWLSVSLSAALISSVLLTGCGSEKQAESSTSSVSNSTSAATSTAEQLEPVELTWYFVGGGQEKDAELVNAEASKYLKDKINASIKLIQFDWGSYDTKMNAMVASGEEFDLAFTCGWAFSYRQNATRGAFAHIDDNMLDKYAPEAKEIIGQDLLTAAEVNGKVYALPVVKEKAHNFGILFNKALVDKYSIDYSNVKTLADLEPVLKTIKEKEPSIYPLVTTTKPGPLVTFVSEFNLLSGAEMIPGALYPNNDAGNTKVFNQYDTPEYKEYLKIMRKWFNEGLIRKDAATLKNDPSIDEGKYFAYPLQMKPGKAEEQKKPAVEWVQHDITPVLTSNMDTNGSMTAISTTSKNPERAMMLLNLMYTDKTLINTLLFGIENTHYTKKSDNVIEIKQDSGYDKYAGSGWMFGNQFIQYLNVNEDPMKWDKLKDFNSKATALNSLGFTFNNESVKTELAALNNVCLEYLPVLVTGSVDPDKYLPIFLNKLKESGSEKVIAEIQTQYDEFLKAKK